MTGWAGTALQLIGVFGLTTRIIEPHIAFQWMLFGSTAWMIESYRKRLWSVFVLNGAFTLSNVIGIYQWFAA